MIKKLVLYLYDVNSLKKIETLQPINEAGAVAKKQVFGSEAKLAGKGCQTFAFVRQGICFFFSFSPLNYQFAMLSEACCTLVVSS